jgi:3-oxoacyl-[acyl-carrier protein] reductase
MERALLEEIPLRRFGGLEEVAELVCLLASPATPWITGTILLADGGWTLPRPMAGFDGSRIVRRRRTE